MKWESKVLDWRGAFENAPIVKVEREDLVCFKIIPDKSITNYSNYKFFKDMAELEKINNLKLNLANLFGFLRNLILLRFKELKDGFKIVYKTQTNYVWYEIVIRDKSINFYVICYESNADFVYMKLEQVFPHAPIEVVDVEETEIPEEDTMIADLKLQRHNFFSIHTNYQEQAQPIEDLLASAEDVQGDDVLKFSLRVQPYDRNYWTYKAEEWEAMVKKGKTPKRIRISKAGMMNALFGLSEVVFQKIGELFREIHEIAFKKHKTQQIIVNHSDYEMREVGNMSRQTHYKMTAPVFRASMRIASHSPDYTRRNMNLRSMSSSFIDLKDTNNSIVRTAIYDSEESRKGKYKKAYEEVSNHKVTTASLLDFDFNIMCDKELGKINMLPTAKLQKKLNEKMDILEQVEAPIPREYLTGEGIPIGVAQLKGEEYPITIPDGNPDTWALPIISSGIQGVGKDTVATNWVYENSKRGRSALILDIIDEKDRGMTDVLKAVIPPEKFVLLDFSHPDYTPYLDWAEGMKSDNRFTKNRLASELVKFFETADDGAGLQTERYLRNCIKALPKASLIEQSMILLSEEVRKKAIKVCKDRGDISTANFWELYEAEGEGRKKQISAPIFNRLSKLIDDPALKPIFGQTPNGSIDFDTMTREGKIIVCRMPKASLGTTGIRTLTHWLLVKIWLTKQVQLHEGRKCETIVMLNEIHQVMSKGLENTLLEIYPEARKHGLQVFTLFHDIAQIPKDLFDIMLASGANFMIYKQKTEKAWKRFGNRITDSFDIDECMRMQKFEAMVGFLVDVEDLPVIRVKMNDMPHKRVEELYDNEETIKSCLKIYHRPIDEVETELLDLEEKMFGNPKAKKKTTSKKPVTT